MNINRMKYVLLLSKYIKNYHLRLFLCILIHGLYKLMPICLGFETSLILSKALMSNLDNPNLHFIVVLFMVIATAILNYLDIYVSHNVAYKILTELRGLSYEKIVQIAPAGIQEEKSGNIMSIVLEDIEILEWFYAHSIIQVFVAVVLSIIALLILSIFSIILSLLTLVVILIMIFIPYLHKKKSDFQGSKVQSDLGELNNCIVDGIQGIKDIITFKWQGHYFKRMYEHSDKYNKSLFNYSKRAVKEGSTINMIMGFSAIITTLATAHFAISGKYSIQWMLPLISLTTMIYSPLQEVLSMSSNYGRIFASAKRVFDFLNIEPEIKDTGTFTFDEVNSIKSKREIKFESVCFSYERKYFTEESLVLKGLSFEVKENETVVLVGASGCGKSTVVKLLQRFWDVDGGGIFINGINIKEIKLRELRKLVAIVPQDVYIFNKSIKDNLKLANEEANVYQINDALKKSNSAEFVSNLKNGIDTVVGEKGDKLSGGEKQRISIAQAFLRNSPIVVFDEITSNLDYNNEKIINEAIERLKEGKITLMVAHRLSTIKNADKIVFIHNGVCNQTGRYEELIESNLEFRKVIGNIEKD